jgi:hypothetical protein
MSTKRLSLPHITNDYEQQRYFQKAKGRITTQR